MSYELPQLADLPHGLHEDVPADHYHRLPHVSPSRAKFALESALAYKAAIEEPFKPTDEMDLGTACHTAVFEPDMIPLRIVVWTGGARRGEKWEAFQQANYDKLILTSAAWSTVLKVRDRVQQHPVIRDILAKGGKREVSLRWEQGHDGHPLQCKGRMDYVADRIYDLKTSHRIDEHAVIRTVVDRSYHMQLAAYRHGLALTTGEVKGCVLIFAQTKQPYDARVYVLQPPELKLGLQLWNRACDTIARAYLTSTYEGMSEIEEPLYLPEWAFDSDSAPTLTLDGAAVEM